MAAPVLNTSPGDLPERDEAMIRYYAERAPEYDRIYELPERQADLERLRTILRGWATDRHVLEVACGTGYWTQELARTARSIRATDAAPEMLDLARRRAYACRVTFAVGDALDPIHAAGLPSAAPVAHPSTMDGSDTLFFAGFLLSHLPRAGIAALLEKWERSLGGGARLAFVDNRFVPASSRPVTRTDSTGNTFQRRRLDSGSEFEVMKNFFTTEELRGFVGDRGRSVEITELEYYWTMRYTSPM